MATRFHVGDIFEVETEKGLGYIQYTHWTASEGYIIRIIRGIHPMRPTQLEDVANSPTLTMAGYALDAAVRRGMVCRIGNASVPESDRPFPTFRAAPIDRHDPEAVWWLWNGTECWPAGTMSADLRRLPIRGVIGHPILQIILEDGWTPEVSDDVHVPDHRMEWKTALGRKTAAPRKRVQRGRNS